MPYTHAFHGNLWAKGDTFWGASYLKVHPLGNRSPELGSPTYTRTVDRSVGWASSLGAMVMAGSRGSNEEAAARLPRAPVTSLLANMVQKVAGRLLVPASI
ncbi:hypothetical protein E2C01_027787 [Portunus trituberculatus]|uniref:Uncharacterized protein n=1 Tax=Portunus trituberculatus TaxID=210409 RepID=A0A5B7EIS3_PORTR|nr:hypothetical protein [Portunus trituberculatus]